MASKTITATLLTRSDTEANFQTSNPVLSVGEMAISTDKGNMFKVGDGVNTWSDLSYNSVSWSEVVNKPSASSSNPINVGVAASAGTATNYSREDHTHAITLATGDNNGQVKIAGQNIDVKGLQNSAYQKVFVGTTAEWDQLSTEQKKTYDRAEITDDYVEPSNPDAEDVSYDNTTSGMVADNVQSAIDTLANNSATFVGTTAQWDNLTTDQKKSYKYRLLTDDYTDASIGNLNALTTTDKSSVVGAINEVNSNKQPKTDNNLQTTSKETTGAINELKSGLASVPIIKTFEISVSAGATSINFSDSRPADFLHAICASSRSGGGAVIMQLNDIYIYFSSSVPNNAIIQIVYLART